MECLLPVSPRHHTAVAVCGRTGVTVIGLKPEGGEDLAGGGHSTCQGPEAALCLACWRDGEANKATASRCGGCLGSVPPPEEAGPGSVPVSLVLFVWAGGPCPP